MAHSYNEFLKVDLKIFVQYSQSHLLAYNLFLENLRTCEQQKDYMRIRIDQNGMYIIVKSNYLLNSFITKFYTQHANQIYPYKTVLVG